MSLRSCKYPDWLGGHPAEELFLLLSRVLGGEDPEKRWRPRMRGEMSIIEANREGKSRVEWKIWLLGVIIAMRWTVLCCVHSMFVVL